MGKNVISPSEFEVVGDVGETEHSLLLEKKVWGGMSAAGRR